MKRQLLDQLAAAHDFPVPESMVDAEFQQIQARFLRRLGAHLRPSSSAAKAVRAAGRREAGAPPAEARFQSKEKH